MLYIYFFFMFPPFTGVFFKFIKTNFTYKYSLIIVFIIVVVVMALYVRFVEVVVFFSFNSCFVRTIISSRIPLLVVVYVTVFSFDIRVVVIKFLTYVIRPALLPSSIVAINRNRIKLVNVYFYAVYRPNVLHSLLTR